MSKIGLMMITIITLGSAACSSKPNSTVNVTVEKANIMALESAWSDLYGARDVEGIAALLTKDTVLITPGEPPVVGMTNVVAATKAMLAADDVETSWTSTAAFVAPSGEMAYDYGTSVSVLADGTEATGSYLVVWVRENGEWKIAMDIFN